jgi:ABC-type bacteriocin/lantibiotic exporter with double-glycine peptidase domain
MSDANGPLRQTANKPVQKIKSILFNDVHFSYNEISVLTGFECSLYAGSFIGISGNSGSGKTTFIQLLLGFCTESSGSILFNEELTRSETRMAYWNKIAYVKQEPFILHDSMLNNIVLFEANYNKERLKQVLEITGLDDLLNQFPEGVNKILTESGRNISGGQRKRIAIARALYKDADVILLDEPFSELDEQSEFKMLQHLKQLALTGKMIVLISHSHNSFQLCHTVINF